MVEEVYMSIDVSKFTFYKSKLLLWFPEMSLTIDKRSFYKTFICQNKKGVARRPPPPLVKTLKS